MADEPTTASDRTQQAIGNVRWMVSFALFVSVFIAFIDRLNISYAMPQLADEFGWSIEEVGEKGGLLMGSFYIAYGISNMFLSPIAARIGPRKSLFFAVLSFSIFTAMGAPLSFSVGLFIGTRVLLGLSEGIHFPMMTMVTKHWFPVHERSRANGLWTSGGMVATILTPIILVPIIDNFGWKAMLYTCGALGVCITTPVLYRYVHDTPRKAPRISQTEIDYIENGCEKNEDPTAYWDFLKNPSFWLISISGAMCNYCIVSVISWLPTYFVEAKGIDFASLTYTASLPYITGLFAFILYAFLGDYLNRRAILASIGFFGGAISIYCATTAPNLPLTIISFAAATFLILAYTAQEFSLIQRIVPAACIGKATGIYNGIAVLVGSVGGTIALGQVIKYTGSYDAGMYSVVVAALIGSASTFALSRRVKY